MNNKTYMNYISIFLISLIFNSCSIVPSKEIDSFGKSSLMIKDSGVTIYNSIDRILIDKKIHEIAIDKKTGLSKAKLKEMTKGTFAQNDASKDLKIRLKALNILTEYGGGLMKLSNANSVDNMKNEAESLHEELVELNQLYIKKTGNDKFYEKKDVATFTAIASGLGRIYIEQRKKILIKRIIITADPAIQKLCKILASELSTKDMIQLEESLSKDSLASQMEVFNAYGSSMNYKQRREFIIKTNKLYIKSQNQSKSAVSKFAVAAESLAKAHAKLKESASNEGFDFKASVESIKELQKAAKDAKEHYKQLTAE